MTFRTARNTNFRMGMFFKRNVGLAAITNTGRDYFRIKEVVSILIADIAYGFPV